MNRIFYAIVFIHLCTTRKTMIVTSKYLLLAFLHKHFKPKGIDKGDIVYYVDFWKVENNGF